MRPIYSCFLDAKSGSSFPSSQVTFSAFSCSPVPGEKALILILILNQEYRPPGKFFMLELTMFYGKMITLCSYACIRAVCLSLS